MQARTVDLCRTLHDCFISNAIKNNQLIVANNAPGAISQNLLHGTVCTVFSLPSSTLQNFGRENIPFASVSAGADCKREHYLALCMFFLCFSLSFFFLHSLFFLPFILIFPSFFPSFHPFFLPPFHCSFPQFASLFLYIYLFLLSVSFSLTFSFFVFLPLLLSFPPSFFLVG